MLTEILWCNHLKISENPMMGTGVPHVGVNTIGMKGIYLVVEGGSVKVLCPSCFRIGVQPIPKPAQTSLYNS